MTQDFLKNLSLIDGLTFSKTCHSEFLNVILLSFSKLKNNPNLTQNFVHPTKQPMSLLPLVLVSVSEQKSLNQMEAN